MSDIVCRLVFPHLPQLIHHNSPLSCLRSQGSFEEKAYRGRVENRREGGMQDHPAANTLVPGAGLATACTLDGYPMDTALGMSSPGFLITD